MTAYATIPTALTTDAPPAWVRDAAKPWRFRNSSKPFAPKPFEVGDTVTWREEDKGQLVTGQVWANHPWPKTRWVVADGKAYAVRERDLLPAAPVMPPASAYRDSDRHRAGDPDGPF